MRDDDEVTFVVEKCTNDKNYTVYVVCETKLTHEEFAACLLDLGNSIMDNPDGFFDENFIAKVDSKQH